ncbi:hypothetical protein HCN44_007183 [Aphidius gifuensis]|uniref:Uncharacterized protein n=1 Tax=Aphidius gifuensis TaxID=684658 RepID=A0A834XKH2_APHGI|nr:hypothetical protein HCN44_007183 [Aphidius gifuensis]
MGEQPQYPQPSPVEIPNTIIEKRQQLINQRITCLQNEIRDLKESLSKVECDLCAEEPIVKEFVFIMLKKLTKDCRGENQDVDQDVKRQKDSATIKRQITDDSSEAHLPTINKKSKIATNVNRLDTESSPSEYITIDVQAEVYHQVINTASPQLPGPALMTERTRQLKDNSDAILSLTPQQLPVSAAERTRQWRAKKREQKLQDNPDAILPLKSKQPPVSAAERQRQYRARKKKLLAQQLDDIEDDLIIYGDVSQEKNSDEDGSCSNGPSEEEFSDTGTVSDYGFLLPYSRYNEFHNAHKEFKKKMTNNEYGSSSDESTQLDPPDEFNSEFEDGQNEFELEICAEYWEKIKPIYSQHKRTTLTLNPREWSNLICDKFHQKFREHKCAYVFKRSEVYVSERRKYFLKITGKCCSDKCGNDFVGVANDDLSTTNGKLPLKIKTRDTSQVWQHVSVARPLNGSKREILGKSAVAEGSNELHRRLCKDLLMPGELKAPKTPQINAIRRAKQEASDNRFGIERKKGEDAFDRLRRAKYTPSYHGLIQEIGPDLLFVFYGTREQIFFYKKMHKKMGGKVSLSIDASGRFILKLLRAIGPPAAHTFLFLIVAHFGTTSVSIYQMLSESQVTERITYFLRVFLRLANYKKPLWITIDFSRALLSATCLACNDINIEHDNSICFNAAKSEI